MLDRDHRWFLSTTAAVALVVFALGTGMAPGARYVVGRVREISRCPGQNAEVDEAVDPTGNYVYEEWIGCNGIGFARSTDGGRHFRRAVRLRASGGRSWDPAVAVAPNGTVYAAFMVTRGNHTFPVVLTSFDHGASFPRKATLIPPRMNNWGDRDFIAAGPGNRVYLTWDYGPDGRAIKVTCGKGGSCGFSAGDLNIVLQVSTNGGKTFGSMIRVTSGYPAGGADTAPLLVDPSGRIDVLYQRYRVSRKADRLGLGSSYFTSSTDGGRTWSQAVEVGRSAGTMSPGEWWIDGAIAIDAGGNLYATWDTQTRRRDVGWLAYSTDQGVRWSAPVRVTPGAAEVPHIVQSAGGPDGIVYVGWLTNQPHRGYAAYLRTFSIARGWLSPPRRVSRQFGSPGVWPGDTFGISARSPDEVVLSWGSALRSTGGNSEIYAAPVRVR